MHSRRIFAYTFLAAACVTGLLCRQASAVETFRAGAAEKDVTPPPGLPMWGYGARHDLLSEGALDPLLAKAVVLEANGEKLAIVGMDLGRGPTPAMMKRIREELASRASIKHVLISGSHTHHGPVIELTDKPGRGAGKFDAAVAYSRKLPDLIIAAVLEADRALKPARIGAGTKSLPLNRNRQAKRLPKPTDPMLGVLRLDDEQGKPIAILVNWAAHPVMTDGKLLKYSADYPGFLRSKVESSLSTRCVFLQGASGDLSTNPGEARGPGAYGELLADHVIELAKQIKTETPESPSIAGRVKTFHFKSHLDLKNPVVSLTFDRAFFPELVRNAQDEFGDEISPELNVVLLNGRIALAAGSGEFFCNHAARLKERSYVKDTFFIGYCNGHHMYFPTIEAAFEGGYGADPGVSLAELGSGEAMMNEALILIYTLQGRFAAEKR